MCVSAESFAYAHIYYFYVGQTKCTVIAIYNTIIRIIMLTGKWGAVSVQCSVCEVFVNSLCSVCVVLVKCLVR